MNIPSNNKNIISKGAEDISVTKVDLNYFANHMEVINKIDDHPYDIHLDNIPFQKHLGENVNMDIFRQTLKDGGIFTLDRVYDIQIIDHVNNGISLEHPYSNDASPFQKSKYRNFDRIIFACNQFIAEDSEKEETCRNMWKKSYLHNEQLYTDNMVENKTRASRLYKIEQEIKGFIKKIDRESKRTRKTNDKLYELLKRTYEFMSREFRFNSSENIDFGFNRELFHKIGIEIDEKVDKNRKDDKSYLRKKAKAYITFLTIFARFLHSAFGYMQSKGIKTINDGFNLDVHEIKIAVLQSTEDLFGSYEETNIYNFYSFYDYFILYLNHKMNKLIKNYVIAKLRQEQLFQYGPLPSIIGFFVLSLYLTISYNFTLLKEIGERNNLALIYGCISLFAVFIIFNIVRNKRKKKKYANSTNAHIEKICLAREKSTKISILVYVLVTIILFSFNIFYIFRYDGYDANLYYVNGTENNIVVDGLRNEEKNLYVIPETIDGKKIENISTRVFNNNQAIKQVYMDNYSGVFSESCFANADNLVYVKLPTTKTKIPKNCFYNCTSLKQVQNDANITEIGENAFENCNKLNNIDIHNVTSLGACAFMHTNITRVTFNNDLAEIPKSAFEGCKLLTFSALPVNLKRIGDSAFLNCKNLTSLIFYGNIESIGANAFNECTKIDNVSIDKIDAFRDMSAIFGNAKANIKKMTIKSAHKIDEYAFKGFKKLNYIEIKDVNEIGDYAFKDCFALESVNLDTLSLSIGVGTFMNCGRLNNATFIDKIINEIPAYAFTNTSINGSIVFDSSVKSIGESAFSGSNIRNILLPKNIEKIGVNAFLECNIMELSIPKGTQIGAKAFEGNNIKDLSLYYHENNHELQYFLGANVNALEKIKYIDAEKIRDKMFCGCTSLKDLSLTVEPTEIGDYAFYNCGLLPYLDIFGKLEAVPDYAFFNCSAVNDISQQFKNVKEIGNYSFAHCGLPTILTIPENVVNIGNNAFMNCYNVSDILLNDALVSIGENAFNGCARYGTLQLKDSIQDVGNIIDNSHFNTLNVTINNGNRTLADIFDYHDEMPFYAVNCEYNGNKIIDDMFANLSSARTLSINSGNITSIGARAFRNMKSIKSIDIKTDGLTLGEGAFDECIMLESLPFDTKIKDAIPNGAFSNCHRLDSMRLNNSVTKVGNNAFLNCYNLNSIKLENLKTIGVKAFQNTQLSNIVFNNELKEINENAFAGCVNLAFSALPKNLQHIRKEAFRDCISINDVIMPESLETIGSRAFYNCNAITYIKFNEKIKEISDLAFSQCYNISNVEMYNSSNVTSSFVAENMISNIIMHMVDKNKTMSDNFENVELLSNITLVGNFNKVPDGMFAGCTNVKKIDIGNTTIDTIGDRAFEDCKELNQIIFKHGELKLGKASFKNCKEIDISGILKSVKTEIPDDAFNGCKKIYNLVLNNTVTRIGDRAFANNELTNFDIGKNIKEIGSEAFAYNTLSSLVIPKTITKLGKEAFANNIISNVTMSNISNDVTMSYLLGNSANNVKNIKYTATKIPDNMFTDCYNLDRLEIVGEIESIGNNAFRGVHTTHLLCDFAHVKTIGDYAFKNTRYIYDMNKYFLNVEEIGKEAFSGCTMAPTWKIPSSVRKISEKAFYNVNELRSIELQQSIPELDNNAFKDLKLHSFITNSNVSSLKNIDFSYVNDLVIYMKNDKTMKDILGDYNVAHINNVTIEANKDELIDNMFSNCTRLREIKFTNKVKSIGDNCFNECTYLQDFTFLLNVESIGDRAFYNCNSLSQLALSNNLTEIGNEAFMNCTSLREVESLGNVKRIGDRAFMNTRVNNVMLPSNVEYIGKNAFESNVIVLNISEKSQENMYDWDFNWDSNGDFARAINLTFHWAKVSPEIYYPVVAVILLAITALVVTCVILIKRKRS